MSSPRGTSRILLVLVALVAQAIARPASEGIERPGKPGEKPQEKSEKLPPAVLLEPGVEVEATVATELGQGNVKTFAFTVPENAVGARLDLLGRGDVNLYVARHRMKDHEKELVAKSAQSTGAERVILMRDGDSLEGGEYFADVSYDRKQPPKLAAGGEMRSVAFSLKLTLFTTRVDGEIAPGDTLTGRVEPRQGWFRTYTVEVPEGTKVLRVDLFGAPEDLNLRARRNDPMTSSDEADATATTGLGTEVLLVKSEGEDDLAGTWYVDVLDPHLLEFAVPFHLRATFKAEPEPDLLVLPAPAEPRSPLERAIFATVDLLDEEGGGSGVLISERGHLITNYHVVQDKVESRGLIGAPISVALTIDPRDPPRELFRAHVVTASAELDLALLQCDTGFYGQPLPPDFRFPRAALGRPERLTIGDPLTIVGYPEAGGSGSRVSVTVSRGIVAGFERRGDTLHMKTDAMINSGNSGGPVLDERFEVVGFTTETIGDPAENAHGQIGYLRPLWLVPAQWWRIAGVSPPPRKP